jgi:hypothetical protein
MNKRIGLNESTVLQPSIIREFREREGNETVAEQSPERQVTISRKKAQNPETFGIKINNLNPTLGVKKEEEDEEQKASDFKKQKKGGSTISQYKDSIPSNT